MPNTLTVLNPRTGDAVSRVHIAGADDCAAAAARARQACPAWARTPATQRAAALHAAADAVHAAAAQLADLNERETARPQTTRSAG